jgi:hypothetical protein
MNGWDAAPLIPMLRSRLIYAVLIADGCPPFVGVARLVVPAPLRVPYHRARRAAEAGSVGLTRRRRLRATRPQERPLAPVPDF